MIDYRKPLKAKANEAYLQQRGISKQDNPYQEQIIDQKKLFLIICEGDNTEKGYFEGFPVPTKNVIVEGGCGSKTALVEHALRLQKEKKYEGREIWCVFDFDVNRVEAATQPEDFNQSIEKAYQNGMKVAWSNDAFELWFVLHYQHLESAFTRFELNPILREKWGLDSFSKEAKSTRFCAAHYERFGGTKSTAQALAIRRAKALHETFAGRKDYAKHCPCTTVYELVEELNKNLKG